MGDMATSLREEMLASAEATRPPLAEPSQRLVARSQRAS
jgi:hypothetical protein